MLRFYFLCLFTVVFGKTEFNEENNVAMLTKQNFDAVVEEYDYVLVDFFAPWCGHCKALKPEFEKAALQVKTDMPNVLLAMVDATVEADLAEKYKVAGYPTLKFRKNGRWVDYNGERLADQIISWIKRKTGPAMQELKTIEDVEAFKASGNVVVVGFLKDGQSNFKNILEEAADAIDNFPFGFATSSDILEKYGVSKDVQVTMFKSFDDGRTDYDGEIVAEKIKLFVQGESVPLVVEFTQESAASVFGSPIRMHVVAFAPKSGEHDELKTKMSVVAKNFRGKVHFIIVDTDVEDHQRILDFFGMTKADVPSYRLINLTDDMTKFKPDSPSFDESEMSRFVTEVLDGSRKPFLMSQPIPPQSDDPVTVLVGENFNLVTRDLNKAVFVKLYAPWCGHCQQLAPIWTSLGEAFKDRDDIIIAKIDATVNEAEGLRVHSFPTIKYYPKGSTEPIDYTGDRTFEALKQFVESEGKVAPSEGTSTEKETKDEL